MILYKGVQPKSYWASQNPGRNGFRAATARTHGADEVVRHIIVASSSSPYLSFTASYAIACGYATDGGEVYEIDTSKDPACVLIDPVYEISMANRFLHAHSGEPYLIVSLADADSYDLLKTPPRQLTRPKMGVQYRREYMAMVFAMRDAEVLTPTMSPTCIVDVHRVP